MSEPPIQTINPPSTSELLRGIEAVSNWVHNLHAKKPTETPAPARPNPAYYAAYQKAEINEIKGHHDRNEAILKNCDAPHSPLPTPVCQGTRDGTHR